MVGIIRVYYLGFFSSFYLWWIKTGRSAAVVSATTYYQQNNSDNDYKGDNTGYTDCSITENLGTIPQLAGICQYCLELFN